jgi:hypothetical protein
MLRLYLDQASRELSARARNSPNAEENDIKNEINESKLAYDMGVRATHGLPRRPGTIANDATLEPPVR